MIFRGGVVSALGKGVATKHAPQSAQNPREKAKIVYAAQGVFRTGRTVKTGMARKMSLVKDYKPHGQHFEGIEGNNFV